MKNKIFNIISMILNITIIVLVSYSVANFFIYAGQRGNPEIPQKCFMYFTVDSNILVALCSAIILVFNVLILFNKRTTIPKWANIIKLMGTVAVTITLLTVCLYLGPINGFEHQFAGDNLYMHLLCPLFALISFIVFEDCTKKLNWKHSFFVIIPLVAYGIVYLTMVVILHRWDDFYSLNIGGMWYLSFAVMLLIAYASSTLIIYIKNKLLSKNIS